MDLEREKKRAVVNGKGEKSPTKKKGTKKKSAGKKAGSKKSTAPKQARSSGRKASSEKPKRRRGKRRRNPSVDVKGSAVAFMGGMLAGAVGAAASTHAQKLTDHATGKKVLGVVAAGAAPALVGLAVQTVHGELGKGMVAGGGALLAERALSEAATKVEFLKKAGFVMSSLPPEFSYENGQVFRTMPDGSKKVMFAAEAKPAQLTMPDGTVKGAQLLGAEGDQAIILDETGNLRVLSVSPLDGIQPRQQLDGIQPRQNADALAGMTEGYSA